VSTSEGVGTKVLTGRVAIVTGASRGIGEAVARLLVATGVRTALVARSVDGVTAISRDLANEGGVALPLGRDLSNPMHAYELVKVVADELGPVELLVNNAASVAPLGSTARVPVEDWTAAVCLNLVAPLATMRAALPGMLDRGFGRIVNVSTGAATASGMLGGSAYSASKAGLEMLTRNLAVELDDTGVTVAAVRPGRVDTDMQRFLRAQSAGAVGSAIVDRAWAFLNEGQLIEPSVPAHLILRVMQQGLNGAVVSVYDDRGRAMLSDLRYAGDGSME
jgi:NAD(P)-dependent dehydrogenase (short-subunit alcohol dehydrogenase family)